MNGYFLNVKDFLWKKIRTTSKYFTISFFFFLVWWAAMVWGIYLPRGGYFCVLLSVNWKILFRFFFCIICQRISVVEWFSMNILCAFDSGLLVLKCKGFKDAGFLGEPEFQEYFKILGGSDFRHSLKLS